MTTTKFSSNYDSFRASGFDIPSEYLSRAFQFVHSHKGILSPISVHFDLTLRCSCKCTHCRQWTWPRHTELSLDQVGEAFHALEHSKVKTITIGGGEPLLSPQFIGVIELAKEHGFHIGVISSGSMMSEAQAYAIAQCCDWIRFSLDGPSEEIHDRIRGASIFKKLSTAVRTLNSLRAGTRLSLGLNCVIQKENILFVEETTDLAHTWQVDRLLFKVVHGNGKCLPSYNEWKSFREWLTRRVLDEDSDHSNLRQLHELFEGVYDLDGLANGFPVRSFYMKHSVRCFAPLFFRTMSSNGDLFPCDYLQYDTREWRKHSNSRKNFNLGNLLHNGKDVERKLELLFLNDIHHFPAKGFAECGACTRFCQLNRQLTDVYREHENDMQSFIDMLGRSRTETQETPYL